MALGATAFLTAHLTERLLWTSFFGDGAVSTVAWFTNSGRAVLFTVTCVAVASLIAGVAARERRDLVVVAANVAGGGIVAMLVALGATGVGTIFPLVIVIGGALVIAGAFAGALIVSPTKR